MAKIYGGGVVHQDSTAQNEVLDMTLNPSLVRYNMQERAISGLNEAGEVFKLMSPKMMFVRGFINVDYNNEQIFNYPYIEQQLKLQAGTNEILHGIYIVKFTSKTGVISELCSLETDLQILSAPVYTISDSDMFLIIYEHNAIKKITHINDKTSYFFQEVNNILQALLYSIRGKKDFLPKYKGTPLEGLLLSRWYDTGLEAGVQLSENSLITFRTTQETAARTDIYNNSDFYGTVTDADGVAFTAKEGGFKVVPSNVATETDLTIFEPTRKTAPNTFIKKNLLLNVLDKIIFGFEAGRNIIFTNLKAWFNTDVELKKKLIDGYGTAGELGMYLISNGQKVQWRWNRIFVQYTHTHPDAYIQLGYSPTMIGKPYQKLVSVHFYLNSSLSDTGQTLKVRVLGITDNGIETTIEVCEIFNGRSNQKFFIPETTVQYMTLRTEVIQTPPSLRGLTVSFEFFDWS